MLINAMDVNSEKCTTLIMIESGKILPVFSSTVSDF